MPLLALVLAQVPPAVTGVATVVDGDTIEIHQVSQG